jgi:hypothetical protein
VGLGQDAVTHWRVKRARHGRRQEGGRILTTESVEYEFGKLRQPGLAFGFGYPEDDANGFLRESASNELHRLGRGLVKPLRVVHHTDQGLLLGHLAEQGERGQAHKQVIWCVPGLLTESSAQRLSLEGRQPRKPVQVGATQLVQPSVGELQL